MRWEASGDRPRAGSEYFDSSEAWVEESEDAFLAFLELLHSPAPPIVHIHQLFTSDLTSCLIVITSIIAHIWFPPITCKAATIALVGAIPTVVRNVHIVILHSGGRLLSRNLLARKVLAATEHPHVIHCSFSTHLRRRISPLFLSSCHPSSLILIF